MDKEFRKFIVTGSAVIYKKNNVLYKKYTDNFYASFFGVNEDVFYALKSIDNKHLMKLYKLHKKDGEILGYTCKYIKPDKINILKENISYTLDNLRELEKLNEILTKLNIEINDAHEGNIILQKNNVIIIDIDLYCIKSRSHDYFIIHNKEEILNYIRRLYLERIYDNEVIKKIKELFNFKISKDTELSYELSKRLTCKRPIDLIRGK